MPWFVDTFTKRKYYLVEGQDDTYFRLYRENNAINAKTNTWFSVAGSIEEIASIANKFEDEQATQSKAIAGKIKAALPRFEAGEEKRKRRDYRLARKAAFTRPEPGFSFYEGRTRGKRMKYTFSDEETESDDQSMKRSTRTSGITTPGEAQGPTVTASGRQVKSRLGGMYGETKVVDRHREIDSERRTHAAEVVTDRDEGMLSRGRRVERSARNSRASHPTGSYANGMESDEDSEAAPSEDEWSGNEEEPDESEPDLGESEDDDAMSGLDPDNPGYEEEDNTKESLVVQLRYKKGDGAKDLVIKNHERPDNSDGPAAGYKPIQVPNPSTEINGVIDGDVKSADREMNGVSFHEAETSNSLPPYMNGGIVLNPMPV